MPHDATVAHDYGRSGRLSVGVAASAGHRWVRHAHGEKGPGNWL